MLVLGRYEFWPPLALRCLCHQIQKAKIMAVKGMVAARKYHHSGRTRSTVLPFSSVAVSKKVIPNIAYTHSVNMVDEQSSKQFGERVLTETNVPGRKSMVIAAMVIIDELSLFASSAIRFDVFAISMLVRLSFWLAMLKNRSIHMVVRVI